MPVMLLQDLLFTYNVCDVIARFVIYVQSVMLLQDLLFTYKLFVVIFVQTLRCWKIIIYLYGL